jgi:HlyD family secretion protein
MTLDKEKLASLTIDREAADSKSDSTIVPLVSVIILLAAMAVAAWWWMSKTPEPVPQQKPVEVAIVSPPVAKPLGETVLNASGYVVARRSATVSSKVTGKIVEVLFEEGMNVTEGDVLARLDDSTVRAMYRLSNSQLDASRNALTEIQVRLDEAQRNRTRVLSLLEKQLISAVQLDTADADVKALEARLNVAFSNVRVAENNKQLHQQGLNDLVIRAPFSGVVISKDAQPGEIISPMSAGGGFTRTGICTIVDMNSREIEVDVSETYINRVHSRQQTEATLDAYPDWIIPSRVINIVPSADRQRASIKVRIAFEQLDPRILPEMGIKVRFLEDEPGEQPIETGKRAVPERNEKGETAKITSKNQSQSTTQKDSDVPISFTRLRHQLAQHPRAIWHGNTSSYILFLDKMLSAEYFQSTGDITIISKKPNEDLSCTYPFEGSLKTEDKSNKSDDEKIEACYDMLKTVNDYLF